MSTILLNESKLQNSSKYKTTDIDPTNEYYLFDIHLESNKRSKKIKKISTDISKLLLTNEDNIYFNKYTKINFKIYNLKKQILSHNLSINLLNDNIIHKDKKIYLEINNQNGYLTLFYNLERYN
jgi:hypothetical protein